MGLLETEKLEDSRTPADYNIDSDSIRELIPSQDSHIPDSVQQRTGSDYSIGNNSSLDLSPSPDRPLGGMQIVVKNVCGKTDSLMIESAHTKINHFKGMVEDMTEFNVPHCEQRLIFSGKELEDERTLADYGIRRGDTLTLTCRLFGGHKPKLKISVVCKVPKKMKTINLTVENTDNIGKVKKMIQRMEGIPAQKHCLSFNSIKLEEKRTLASYGIKNGDTLNLI